MRPKGHVVLAWVIGLAAATVIALPVSAQQYPDYSSNVYIDGSVPVDARTRSLVDAYVAHRERLDREEAERRELFQMHIYQDRAAGTQSYGRY